MNAIGLYFLFGVILVLVKEQEEPRKNTYWMVPETCSHRQRLATVPNDMSPIQLPTYQMDTGPPWARSGLAQRRSISALWRCNQFQRLHCLFLTIATAIFIYNNLLWSGSPSLCEVCLNCNRLFVAQKPFLLLRGACLKVNEQAVKAKHFKLFLRSKFRDAFCWNTTRHY